MAALKVLQGGFQGLVLQLHLVQLTCFKTIGLGKSQGKKVAGARLTGCCSTSLDIPLHTCLETVCMFYNGLSPPYYSSFALVP